jgi:hypothetical protein
VGYDSYGIWRYVHFLWVLNTGAPYPHKKLHHDPAAGDIRRFDSPLVDLLNVRWVIAPSMPAPGPAKWLERFAPAPGKPPAARYEPLWDPQLKVYENTQVLPRAFVVYQAQVIPDEQAQVQALATLDPRQSVILPTPPNPAPIADGRAPTPAVVLTMGRHDMTISATLTAAGVLVLSEPFYPGWRAWVDGAEAPLLRGNYALSAVALPAGTHRVELRFSSQPARRGLWLSALGVLALLGLLALHVAFVVRRRR